MPSTERLQKHASLATILVLFGVSAWLRPGAVSQAGPDAWPTRPVAVVSGQSPLEITAAAPGRRRTGAAVGQRVEGVRRARFEGPRPVANRAEPLPPPVMPVEQRVSATETAVAPLPSGQAPLAADVAPGIAIATGDPATPAHAVLSRAMVTAGRQTGNAFRTAGRALKSLGDF